MRVRKTVRRGVDGRGMDERLREINWLSLAYGAKLLCWLEIEGVNSQAVEGGSSHKQGKRKPVFAQKAPGGTITSKERSTDSKSMQQHRRTRSTYHDVVDCPPRYSPTALTAVSNLDASSKII